MDYKYKDDILNIMLVYRINSKINIWTGKVIMIRNIWINASYNLYSVWKWKDYQNIFILSILIMKHKTNVFLRGVLWCIVFKNLKTDYFQLCFFYKVTCASLLQENIKKLSKSNTFKHIEKRQYQLIKTSLYWFFRHF